MPPEQLDQDAVNLAKAIRQAESGGNFGARGASGEFGAYQFMPDTWKGWSRQYLGRDVPLDSATPQEQNEVAYKRIKELKDQGRNVGEIASMWNSGSPTKYLEQWKGKNEKGVEYDTPGYAKKVAEEYQRIKGSGAPVSASNQSSLAARGYDVGQNIPAADAQPPKPEGVAGNLFAGNFAEAGKGAASNVASAAGSAAGAVGGAWKKVMDPFVSLAAMPVQGVAKLIGAPDPYRGGLTAGGEKPLVEVSPLTVKDKAKDALEAGTTVATVAGAAGLGKAALAKLAAPKVAAKLAGEKALEAELLKDGLSLARFSSMTNAQKLDVLGEIAAGASESGKMAIAKAMEALRPIVAKEMGVAAAGKGLIGRALGFVGKNVGKAIGLGAAGLGLSQGDDIVRYLRDRAAGK